MDEEGAKQASIVVHAPISRPLCLLRGLRAWQGAGSKLTACLALALRPGPSGRKGQHQRMRRDAGVVERGSLENYCALTGTQGSNPCLSAIYPEHLSLVSGLRRVLSELMHLVEG